MVVNLEFCEGKYNGSTLSLFGRNAVLNSVREMPIVGGSGVFRFAHGYGEAKTHWFNITSGDAVVEYNVYPCIVDILEEEVVNVKSESLKQRKPMEANKCSSQPVKKPTAMVPESKKQTSNPNKTTLQLKSRPNKPTMKAIFEPNKSTMKPNSEPTKPVHQPRKTTSQPMKPVPQAKKTSHQAKSVPPQSNASSQGDKDSSSGCRVTRSERQVKEAPFHEDDSDSHDSYESTEDELYRSPKVVGDNLYSSDSDSDSDSKKHPRFDRSLSPKSLGLRKEKLSHLHFYFHDILSGQNPTAVRVAQAAMTATSPTFFGAVMMADDPLTVGPEPNSKVIGKAQGIYASASQKDLGLMMMLNFAFMEGKYNGSTVSLLGRNAVFSGVREMSIVGGSGVFRFARGYAQAKTFWLNTTSGDAIVEYNVYVLHY
ncbi:hypothetical protein Ahy_A06g026591 isoform B [Arachis hypogaea]|uniref:Dirigent protein n=1 Tax=Arachis hypogaea TaxID=3818 RepID=A0A445CKZ6_ARAHY|nr:hypothetical protein Ahy_A06g026591 isoform B [Arachis hypogaea]